MHRRGTPEGEPGSQLFGEEAYKQSKWAGVIDSALKVVESERRSFGRIRFTPTKVLDAWALWMKEEGHRLPDEEINEKRVELRRKFRREAKKD